MTPRSVVLFTIVAEAVLEDRLLRDLQSLGVSGWTVSTARGHSSDGMDPGEFEGGNVRLELLVQPALEAEVWRMLQARYFPQYSLSAWATDVRVARREKYA
jgi:nitrogen regulatory protein P-II 2